MPRVYDPMESLRTLRAIPRYLVTLCALLGLVPATGAAQGDPMAFLKAQDREVRGLLKNDTDSGPAREARDAKLGRALETLLDFDELARRSLSDHWSTLSAEQQRQFASLLRQLVERSYKKNLRSTLSYEVKYLKAQRKQESWLVGTEARSRKNRRAPAVSIDYAMAERTGAWKVFDIVTDGVSLVDNYRRQFDRIIKRQGFDALMEKMRKRLGTSDAL